MIVFYHQNYKITEVWSAESGNYPFDANRDIVALLLDFADRYENEVLAWCDENERENLNITAIPDLFHHNKFLFSYDPARNYFDTKLGYIEDSPFIKINKEIRYATWQMSSKAGAVHASVLNACKNDLNGEGNFDYFLNSFARRAMNYGLLCYSEPKLILRKPSSKEGRASNLAELFKFTRQHYRMRWIFLLLFNLMVFERRLPLWPFLSSLFYGRRKFDSKLLDKIPLKSSKDNIQTGTIDVLIPTIGRKEYLHSVLKNLASQTYLPKNIIVIEQNPDKDSTSELDFIQNENWPFTIKHQFTHQTGACNARNIGIPLVESEFTFFADDDIVFENNLLEKAIETFKSTGNEIFLVACLLQHQTVIPQPPRQFAVFGAGHAFVKSVCFEDVRFNMAYEFGFGEDNDFGMQLRNRGFDVLFISTFKILHLKAPIGGFRTKPKLKWQEDAIHPKPSPTVMLFRILYDTKEQLSNYKTMLFFKNLDKKFLLNPFNYVKLFKQKWNRSLFWATELNKQNQQ